MTRKMLKEEKDVMLSVRKIENSCNVGLTEHRKLIVALVRAVREDCAKVAEGVAESDKHASPSWYGAADQIANAIRGGNNGDSTILSSRRNRK